MIKISNDAWENELAIRCLPSVELQFFAWAQLVDHRKIARCIDFSKRDRKLYIRRSTCWSLPLIGRGVTTLDIASVSLAPKLRGNGWFKGFLDLADHVVPWDAILVECVHNRRLGSYLLSADFIEIGQDNFYRPTKSWRAKHSWDEASRKLAATEALASKPVSFLEFEEVVDVDHWAVLA
ncbi:hypothetical protein [Xanthomonas hortorum]|uniref:hypothetical protein n=1 Tax=Xanthomonas hortorum TaxID=56454 RepID=UPI001594584E|nr:hypothetical protein [Xanthomonas hortorum]NHF65288.1 hypothetical protein [Xanthomonas hortorum]